MSNNLIRVKNTKIRDALMNRVEGETVYCEEENQCYVWANGEYQPVDSHIDSFGEIKVNYRDLVISAISAFDPLDEKSEQLHQMRINDWDEFGHKQFYMLYGRELDYFTIFNRSNDNSACCLGREVFACLKNIGHIVYIEDYDREDKAIIFWVKTPEDKLTEVYLFDYTEGVVPFS